MALENQELLNIKGGEFKLTASMAQLILKAYNFVSDLGRYLGTAVSYWVRGVHC